LGIGRLQMVVGAFGACYTASNMKTPIECTSIEDIRAEIDHLDQQIIATIAERFSYVQAASLQNKCCRRCFVRTVRKDVAPTPTMG